ncbi:luciferase-like monooxygenase [Actinocorallia herbida]|uniref:Luciferase-like monooxygenase n=1 Tax=Actinocorallia herbida TaxID=58109 RepID=A0A3N1D0H1_9ACTN|nr:LLM class flavin-dependent oxidoreductase [Actinocorallia herbida]ROO87014.1 luciferase-like monooxygenase [Actinocorallia herbida]
MSRAEIHVLAPTRFADRPDLPGFVTDVRPARRDPVGRAAKAADLAGLAGLVVPFDPEGVESLVSAAGALRATRHARVTAEFHPAVTTPVYAAKLSASLQRFSAGRLDWKIAVDLDRDVARAQGDFLEGPDRYRRAAEFLTIAKGVWHAPSFDFEGEFYQVLAGGLRFPASPGPFPRVYLSGSSPEALRLSAEHADVHVLDTADQEIPDLPGVTLGLRLRLADVDTTAATIREQVDRGVGVFLIDAEPLPDAAYLLGESLIPRLARLARQDKETVRG